MKRIFYCFVAVISALLLAFAFGCTSCASCSDEKTDTPQYTVTLNAQSLSLMAFERYKLNAVVRDGDLNEVDAPIKWESADVNIAAVTDGEVFAYGKGVTEISAVVDENVYAKCSVTVTDDGIIPELRVNQKNLTIGKDQKFSIDARVYFNGEDCTESDTVITFTSANADVATVSAEGVIEAKSVGNTKITIYALWRGIGGPDKKGDAAAIVGLAQTIDLKIIDIN